MLKYFHFVEIVFRFKQVPLSLCEESTFDSYHVLDYRLTSRLIHFFRSGFWFPKQM